LEPGDASAQSRRGSIEPPPASLPIPQIAEETAKCSYAYHSALAPVRDVSIKDMGNLDRIARVSEPGLPGKWLFWSKTAKNATKPPQPERVCAKNVTKSGRERCVEWETKPVDAVKLALFASQPTADELTVLRALDAFVNDKGAALEFGTNGRQYATLQRVAVEIEAYSTQPKNPALCNGVPEMLEFKASKLDGLKKRIDDVGKTATKARAMARQRVTAARELRVTEQAAPAQTNVAGETANATPLTVRASPPAALPATVDLAGLIAAVFEGALPAGKLTELRAETNALKSLPLARDLLLAEASPDLSPTLRAAIAAALRMIEAAGYAEAQAARMQRFDRMFLGTIEQIREAHRVNCTCGG
jgi:hypothetical protein